MYLPAETPSNFSRSVWSTHCDLSVFSSDGSEEGAYLSREVDFNGFDADVLRS